MLGKFLCLSLFSSTGLTSASLAHSRAFYGKDMSQKNEVLFDKQQYHHFCMTNTSGKLGETSTDFLHRTSKSVEVSPNLPISHRTIRRPSPTRSEARGIALLQYIDSIQKTGQAHHSPSYCHGHHCPSSLQSSSSATGIWL